MNNYKKKSIRVKLSRKKNKKSFKNKSLKRYSKRKISKRKISKRKISNRKISKKRSKKILMNGGMNWPFTRYLAAKMGLLPAPAPAPEPVMDSYKSCNRDINDNILSQMRCMVDDGELPLSEINRDTTCHQSQRGLFIVLEKYYNPGGGNILSKLKKHYTWSKTKELLESGEHYIIEASIFGVHSYFIEIKDKKFRIISLWELQYGFLDFPELSIWGKFRDYNDYDVYYDYYDYCK